MSALLETTQQLLRARQADQSLDEIATGAGVGRRWLYMFAKGEIPNPGVVLVQRLHDYLIGRSVPRAQPARLDSLPDPS